MHHLTQTILTWINQYGEFPLFILLALGILGLPIPDEPLITLAGVLLAKGKLLFLPTLLATYAGAACGITLSYLLGRFAGKPLIDKYGHYLSLTAARMQKIHRWSDYLGPWILFFGYFIPGVRHLNGYVAGITLEYKKFALFAYSGAIVWGSVFLTIGYFFGEEWPAIIGFLQHYLLIAAILAVILGLIFYVIYYQWKKSRD